MNWDLFWTHRSVLEAKGLEAGFGVFSGIHFIWLGLMTAGIVIYCVFYGTGSAGRRDNMRKAMAFFIIAFEIFKQCTMALTSAPVEDNLPIEVCSFAEYAMLADALWPDGRFLRQPLLFMFFPAALMALVFPTVAVYPAISFYTIHQFVLHAGIVAYIIARYASGEFVPVYKGIWTSTLKLLPVVSFIYWIDLTFDRSFMFLTNPWGNPVLEMLWKVSGGNGGLAYVGALVLFTIFVMHVLYAVYWLIGAFFALFKKLNN